MTVACHAELILSEVEVQHLLSENNDACIKLRRLDPETSSG